MANTNQTAAAILLRVRVATHIIEAARKQAVSAYDEKLRALRELDAKIATQQSINEPELFDSGAVLNPELQGLLDAPLANLS